MDDQACPRCKTTKYRNPSLKLMVNVCGHNLCEGCVELLFVKGSGSCPECGVPLRRSNFRVQLFENPMVEKEVDIRRRILRDFNKKEEDFATLDEYNNYLEMIEEIIYNLTHNIDIINTNKRIDAYKKENKDVILKNKQRMGREEYELEQLLEQEKEIDDQRKRELAEFELEAKRKKQKVKEALIDELMFSNEDGASIVNHFAKQAEETLKESKTLPPPPPPKNMFSTGIKFNSNSSQGLFLPVPKVEEGIPYEYHSPQLINEGPSPPEMNELDLYMKHIRAETVSEKAGGYKSQFACLRALQEALQGLYS